MILLRASIPTFIEKIIPCELICKFEPSCAASHTRDLELPMAIRLDVIEIQIETSVRSKPNELLSLLEFGDIPTPGKRFGLLAGHRFIFEKRNMSLLTPRSEQR